jgi:peptidoglycan/LPS O-acetylase OafA/YrhL
MTGVLPSSSPRELSPPMSEAPSVPRSGPLRRVPALDGIRAFAVLAVLCYHAGISWVGGGLLGVDVFFVLSGFLITSLLCRELARTTTVRLGRFWAQRARRLLPALFVLLLGVAAYAHFFASSIDVTSVRNDALATLAYVANWHFILSSQGYFAQAASPSPFLHTWSLAVEEQYYLVWPLVALFVVRRWGIPRLALVAGAGALASAALTVAMHTAGFSIDRLYYGTDTRAQSLLVGSFLGAVGSHAGDGFVILPTGWTATRLRRRLWAAAGVVGALFLVWAWHALAGPAAFLYQGGFLLVSVAAGAVVLTCVTSPASPLTRLCSLRPLVFTGRISYGLYLYHWPLFLVINHAHTGLLGAGLLATRLAVTFVVATISFVVLEEPIRTGRFFRGLKGLASAGAVAVLTASAVLLATVAPASTAGARQNGSGVPTAERRALGVAGAFTTRPIRFLILGDSVALTLGVGLNYDSVPGYGVRILDGASLGCDLDQVEVNLSGAVGPPTPGCTDWATRWPAAVARIHPDVIGLLIGRWEVSDHLFQGRWVHVGDPAWDDHLSAEISHAIDLLSAHGVKVVLFTMPYVDPPNEAANGTPFSENDPSRAALFNALLVRAADSHKGKATVIDLNKLLDPNGHYQSVVDGFTVRWSDGIHISFTGGAWLQHDILPDVAGLGLAARASAGTG